MNYEKKYKEASKWVESIFDELTHEQQMQVEAFFPELKESEDERIRKEIIDYIKTGTYHKSWIAWLEKQKYTQRDVDDAYLKGVTDAKNELEKQGEQKTQHMISKEVMDAYLGRDKIETMFKQGDIVRLKNGDGLEWTIKEVHNDGYYTIVCADMDDFIQLDSHWELVEPQPKFNVGDWVVDNNNGEVFQIIKVRDNTYRIICDDGEEFDAPHYQIENNYHLWTIQDAKDGDVLCCESGWTCIFKKLVNDETFSSYCFMDNTKWFCETGSEWHTLNKEFMKVYNGEIKPATKEQRDLLFKKMHEAGFVWDSDKKELKKNSMAEIELTDFESELFSTISEVWQNYLLGNEINIAKVVKEHSAELTEKALKQHPAEWSEEDEFELKCILGHLKEFLFEDAYVGYEKWLKSLKDRVQPQPKQEWSEEDDYYQAFIIELLYGIEDNDKDYENKCRKAANWLKSLRPQKQQEWTQADKNFMNAAIAFVQQNKSFNCWGGVNKEGVIAFLQSLRPRNTWSPSEEQMEVFDMILTNESMDDNVSHILRELKEQLKKL